MKYFYISRALAPEHKQVPGEWISQQNSLHLRRQTVHALAHIDRPTRKIDFCSLRKGDHAKLRISFSTCCSAEPLTSALILIRVPLRSSTSIILGCLAEGAAQGNSGCGAGGRSDFGFVKSESAETMPPSPMTPTGTSAAPVPITPRRHCCRHEKSWLVLTSCRRATTDTDAPGTSVSATICRFCAFVHCR